MKDRTKHWRAAWIGAALLLSLGGTAQAGCDDADNQHEMNMCADAEYKRADVQLNAAYSKLIGMLDGTMKTTLVEAQRAWIVFRDKSCKSEAAENEGGSIYPMVYSGCLARLTTERTRWLNSRAACYQDSEKCQ